MPGALPITVCCRPAAGGEHRGRDVETGSVCDEITGSLRPAVVLPLRSWSTAGTALPTELPERGMLRAGFEPATCRFVVDNRTVSARSRFVAVVGRRPDPHVAVRAGVEPAGVFRLTG